MADQFKNKKVLVLGLAKVWWIYLSFVGLELPLWRPKTENLSRTIQLPKVCWKKGSRLSGHPLELLDEEFALMVKNPGIPYSNPMIEKAFGQEFNLDWGGISLFDFKQLLVSQVQMETTTTTMIGEVLTAGNMVLSGGYRLSS